MNHISIQAERDFENARYHAFLNQVAALIERRPNELVSFEKVRRSLPIYGSSFRGVMEVPIDKIIGTTSNRYADFDQAFLPSQSRTKGRWKRIDEARLRDENLPPIQLYKIGEMYFVRDGHHRVSVARQIGAAYIDAEVVEMRTRAPLTNFKGKLNGDQIEAIGEYASFLEKTRLDEIRQGVDIRFSQPGGYARLLEHILVHQYFLGRDLQRDVNWDEAVGDWYDHWYLPIVQLVRERNILLDFPGRTEGDLYLWIIDHHYNLAQRAPAPSLPDAANDFVEKYSPRLSHKLSRALRQWIAAWRGAQGNRGAAPETAASKTENLEGIQNGQPL